MTAGSPTGEFAQPFAIEIEIVKSPRDSRCCPEPREVRDDGADARNTAGDGARKAFETVMVAAEPVHQNHRRPIGITVLPGFGVDTERGNTEVSQSIGHLSSVAARHIDVGAGR